MIEPSKEQLSSLHDEAIRLNQLINYLKVAMKSRPGAGSAFQVLLPAEENGKNLDKRSKGYAGKPKQ